MNCDNVRNVEGARLNKFSLTVYVQYRLPYVSIHPYVCLSVCPSNDLSICICMCFYPSIL